MNIRKRSKHNRTRNLAIDYIPQADDFGIPCALWARNSDPYSRLKGIDAS
jgi:hypothetical protein